MSLMWGFLVPTPLPSMGFIRPETSNIRCSDSRIITNMMVPCGSFCKLVVLAWGPEMRYPVILGPC